MFNKFICSRRELLISRALFPHATTSLKISLLYLSSDTPFLSHQHPAPRKPLKLSHVMLLSLLPSYHLTFKLTSPFHLPPFLLSSHSLFTFSPFRSQRPSDPIPIFPSHVYPSPSPLFFFVLKFT